MSFDQIRLPAARTAIAPDGSDVRVLLRLAGGSVAHFELAPGETSTAVAHKTVEEIWYVLSGRGQMWRKDNSSEAVTELERGLCLSIPTGTHFQFRALGDVPLAIIGVTMPPWPIDKEEAVVVGGRWEPTLPRNSR
jgi:mannose-6-phosphate isomerase-like protein (cupin superfamily)